MEKEITAFFVWVVPKMYLVSLCIGYLMDMCDVTALTIVEYCTPRKRNGLQSQH